MSDANTSLPVRTETNGDVVAQLCDATVTSQKLAINSVGQIETTSSGSATGGTAAGKSTLAGGQYNTALPTLTAAQQAALQLDSNGRLITTATISNDTNYGTVGTNTLRTASQVGNSSGAADFNAGATGAQTLRTVANQGAPNSLANAWPTKVTDGTNTLAPNSDGSINVKITDRTAGTDINDYKTATVLAAGVDNHDYTAVATFNLTQVEATGSGKAKIEVKINGVTKFVQFNSTATPNMSIHFEQPLVATVGQVVRVVVTNRDNQSQDVYSTISGYSV
jgi:hypothetical protein